MQQTTSHSQQSDMIRAAGGLLWRWSSSGVELAVVHRKRYGDWTLPKGKLLPGESWEEAAIREVREETGYNTRIESFAGAIGYEVDSKPKVVRFWHLAIVGELNRQLDSEEVNEVVWLPVREACSRLQYPLEQALVESWLSVKEKSRGSS